MGYLPRAKLYRNQVSRAVSIFFSVFDEESFIDPIPVTPGITRNTNCTVLTRDIFFNSSYCVDSKNCMATFTVSATLTR